MNTPQTETCRVCGEPVSLYDSAVKFENCRPAHESCLLEDFITIEGETWHARLNRDEYAQWDIYAESHPALLGQSYRSTLEMFLAHLRRGVNLNLPVSQPTTTKET